MTPFDYGCGPGQHTFVPAGWLAPKAEVNLMKRLVAMGVLIAFGSVGCYNTYRVPRTELETLQTSETGTATVRDVEGREVLVKDDTRLYVRSKGGKRYPLTPFNFRMTESQVVASDRDYILDLASLKEEAEVDHVSTWKTVSLISLGAAALAGLVVVTVLSAKSKARQY